MSPSLRILHIDDNAFDRQLVRDALEQDNNLFVVTAAASRQEFEARLTGAGYDLVLTDFNILGFEGLQVIDRIHREQPALPVIVVTGTGSEEVAVEAMKRGAADYVIKTPEHIRRLPLAIHAALERMHLRDERLRSEQALRTSEERLRAFTRALPDLAFIVDENGQFVQLLSASEHQLFVEGETLIGKRIHDIVAGQVADEILAAVRRTIETTTTQRVEYQLEHPAGSRWFEVRTSPMASPPGETALVVYISRNITDRRMAELKLKSERNLLRTLIDNVPDFIFVTDREGRFIASNAAHAAAARLAPPQIIGTTALEVFPADFARRFHDDDGRVMMTGETLVNEERLIFDVHGNQRRVLMTKVPLRNDTNEVIGLVGIARDITARSRAEEALRASEEQLRAVVSSTPVILFGLDTGGMLTFLQGRGVSVFGGEPAQYIGKSILEIFGDAIPDIHAHFRRALAGEETGSIQTIGDVTLDVRYSPLRNKAGEISGIIGVATDITERLKAEKLRIELEKEQEVIALKERFITIASHDFRTPLTIMKMSVNMLESYAERFSPEQQTARLHQIHTQIDRMVQLLDDVLTMSRVNAGKIDFRPGRVALKPLCEQICDNFRHLSENSHSLTLEYGCHQAEVEIDANLVHYVLVNLISNAIKYSPVNGKVRFEVSCDDTVLMFRIQDNGIGIPEKDQARLFEPFHRASNTGSIGGTGLGLSIVKSYVEIHGGHIEFQSHEREGTTFTVRIPLYAAELS